MRTSAIIVLYNDDSNVVEENIKRISRQVDIVYLIDNSSTSFAQRFSKINKVKYLPQYKNLGIAAAQNIGIRKAIKAKSDYIFFSDSDSEIPDGAIVKLEKKLCELVNDIPLTGGICTSAFNETTNREISLRGNFIKEIQEKKVTEVTYMMNSGSLIPTKLFTKVGLMWEDLFIDDVDCEWCWRATKKYHLRFFQDNTITIKHHLGNISKKVGNKTRSISPPQRLFYQYRNFIWMFRKGYAPYQWLLYNSWKYLVKFFYFPLFVRPRNKCFVNILKGIINGLAKIPDQNKVSSVIDI